MQISDLRAVAQWAKSNQSPSEVYNAACRLLDEQAAAEQDLREQYTNALAVGEPFAHHLVDAMLTARDKEMNRLRAELAEAQKSVELWKDGVAAAGQVAGRLRDALNAATREAPSDDEQDAQWRRDERDIAGGFTGNEFPRLWPPRKRHQTPENGPENNGDDLTGVPATPESHEAHGGSQ